MENTEVKRPDLLGDMKRTTYCGDLTRKDAERDVVIMGWVQRRRDLGGLIFVELRDRQGIVQVVFNPEINDGTIFRIVLLEAAFITLGGGVAGALLAKFAIEGSGFNFGGFLPPMSVYWSTVSTGIAMALLMGAVSGLVPAWQASRLSIVNALRRVD